MSGFEFKKNARLTKTDEFSSVFNFRKRISATYIVIHYQPNNLNCSRLGLVVGKKVAKRSVDRNYMRRVLRELFRVHQANLQHVDLIIRVQEKFAKSDFEHISKEIDFLLQKINQRIMQ